MLSWQISSDKGGVYDAEEGQENEEQAAAFLDSHPQFAHVPASHYLSTEQVAQAGLDPAADLHLSPARNGTDGVFAAVFERSGDL